MNKTRIYCLLLCSVFSVALFAQTKAEYFFDNDPGYRRASKVSIDPNAASVTMSTAGLSEGWHIFGLRALGNKAGQTYTHRFLITGQTQTTALSGVEYFIDTDPGRDQATPLSFTPGQTAFSFDLTNTDELSEGVHLLGMRAKYGNRWSQTYTHLFFVSKPVATTELTGVEYWLDIDPGQGEATPVEFASGQSEFALAISNIDELSEGTHLMGARARYGERWSQTYTHLFLHTPAQNVAVTVEEVEAYWDNDTENPISVPFTQEGDTAYITKYDFDMEALAFGPHRLDIHAKVNGVWSILTTYDVCKGAAAMFEFESDPEDVCVGDEILVLNATTDMQDGDVYTWDMGDGTTSTEQDGVFHAYNQAGRYTISLTVESAGCTSVYSREIYIHSKNAPAVSLSRTKGTICAGESVTFTATPTNGGENPVFTWLHNGQAVSGETGAQLILDDLTNGETIQVTMTTDNKCASTQTAQSEVLTQTVYDLPEIEFSFESTYYKDQSAIQLKNFATPAGGTFYINGTMATLFNPKSNSNPAGEYTVRYVVSNANGCEAEAEMAFTLKQEHESYVLTVVSADETMGTVSGSGTYAEGSKVTITATAAEGYTFVQWQDGVTDASREVTVTSDATYTATFAAVGFEPTMVNITVDGDFTDWISYEQASAQASADANANDQNLFEMKWLMDETNIFFYFEFKADADVVKRFNIYMNTDDNEATGSNSYLWQLSAADYMIEGSCNNYSAASLYLFPADADQGSWSWTNTGLTGVVAASDPIDLSNSNRALEGKIAKSSVGVDKMVKVGVYSSDSNWSVSGCLPQRTNTNGSIIVSPLLEVRMYQDAATGLDKLQADGCVKFIHDGQLFILRDGKTYTVQGLEVK